MKRIKVYIASPYTNGNKIKNVERQFDVSEELMNRGYAPFVPLLYHFQHVYKERNEEDWIDLVLEYLGVCDLVIRIVPIIDGEELISNGANIEERVAGLCNIPVLKFNTIEEMCVYLDSIDIKEYLPPEKRWLY